MMDLKHVGQVPSEPTSHKFSLEKKDPKIGGVKMREEGLLFDGQRGGFFHVYSEKGKFIVEKQPCQHEHSIMAVAGV